LSGRAKADEAPAGEGKVPTIDEKASYESLEGEAQRALMRD